MTVYVASAAGTRGIYHTNKDCPRLNENIREWSEADVEKMDYTLCKYCAGETGPRHRTRKALRNRM